MPEKRLGRHNVSLVMNWRLIKTISGMLKEGRSYHPSKDLKKSLTHAELLSLKSCSMQNYKFIIAELLLWLFMLFVFEFGMMAVLDDPLLHRLLD